MKGIEKGRKKKKPTHSSWSVQRKTIGKWISLPYLRWRSNPSTTCLTRSQVEVAFVIFTFQYFTFHFYVYKVLRGIGEEVIIIDAFLKYTYIMILLELINVT